MYIHFRRHYLCITFVEFNYGTLNAGFPFLEMYINILAPSVYRTFQISVMHSCLALVIELVDLMLLESMLV